MCLGRPHRVAGGGLVLLVTLPCYARFQPATAALPLLLQAPVLLEAMSYRSGHHSTSDDSSR